MDRDNKMFWILLHLMSCLLSRKMWIFHLGKSCHGDPYTVSGLGWISFSWCWVRCNLEHIGEVRGQTFHLKNGRPYDRMTVWPNHSLGISWHFMASFFWVHHFLAPHIIPNWRMVLGTEAKSRGAIYPVPWHWTNVEVCCRLWHVSTFSTLRSRCCALQYWRQSVPWMFCNALDLGCFVEPEFLPFVWRIELMKSFCTSKVSRFTVFRCLQMLDIEIQQIQIPLWLCVLLWRFYNSRTLNQKVIAIIEGITTDGFYDLDVKKSADPRNISPYLETWLHLVHQTCGRETSRFTDFFFVLGP